MVLALPASTSTRPRPSSFVDASTSLCSTWYSTLITLCWDVSRLRILSVSRSQHFYLLCMVDLFLLHVWWYALKPRAWAWYVYHDEQISSGARRSRSSSLSLRAEKTRKDVDNEEETPLLDLPSIRASETPSDAASARHAVPPQADRRRVRRDQKVSSLWSLNKSRSSMETTPSALLSSMMSRCWWRAHEQQLTPLRR